MIHSKRDSTLRDEAAEKKAIREFFNNSTTGFFVEVGANEPDAPESQTFHLEKAGWKGILVEPIPELANKAIQKRPNSKVWNAACTSIEMQGLVEFLIPLENNELVTAHASLWANIDDHNYEKFKKIQIQAIPLTTILERENVAKVDFLSIDVEGAELEVLRGLDFNMFKPKLILLEDKHFYLSKHRHLKKQGYKITQRLNGNCWYIPVEMQGPTVSLASKLKLWKRMFISIWIKKTQYAIKHKTLAPFKTL